MKRFLRKLFCKHQFDIVESRRNLPLKIEEMGNGAMAQQTIQFAIQCYCVKCGKVNKQLSRSLTKIREYQIKNEIKNLFNNIYQERTGQIFVRKIDNLSQKDKQIQVKKVKNK